MENLTILFKELINLPKETQWVEFKHNNKDPQEIGEYISAIANTTALSGMDHGYVVWGVENETHQIVGTSFKPNQEKKGNEELVGWLFSLLHPKVDFHFMELEINHLPIVILEISPAYSQPVQFAGIDYIRMGSYKVNLKNHPEKERALWKLFDHSKFEEGIAAESISEEELLKLLDYPLVFDMMKRPFPSTKDEILHSLTDLNFIKSASGNKWSITNLGAILFAKDLNHFRYLKRKILRIILYKGSNRMETIKEQMVIQGYASGFDRYIHTIYNLIPSHEVIEHGIRKTAGSYPEIAIRELVANTLIHQDFSMTGCGPMVEIFADRIEMTNPGRPLVDTNRFIDTAPKSRNESLAGVMRLTGICEERGSGIDKVVMQTEINQLPAPLFEVPGDGTRSVLFAYRTYAELTKTERLNATYLHASLMYVQKKFLTNTSLRERFGVKAENSSMISRLVNDAMKANLIKQMDPDNKSRKHSRYQPLWA